MRRRLVAAAAAVLGSVVPGPSAAAPSRAPAQPERHLAGVVVDLGGGDVRAACVDLGGTERSGIELLRRSGLDVVTEDDAVGTRVCRIASTGCDFPVEPCWCRCQVLGADCTYWSYNTLAGGGWVYARLGPLARTVRHGDVDGWAWGRGSVTAGAQPPVRTFEEVCADALAPTPAPPSPAAPLPSSTTGAAPPAFATATGAPRATARATEARAKATATAGRPAATPIGGAGSATRGTARPPGTGSGSGQVGTPGAAHAPAGPDDPAATADAVARATLAAFPTAWSALMTAAAGQSAGTAAAVGPTAPGRVSGAAAAGGAGDSADGAAAAPAATLVPARVATTAPRGGLEAGRAPDEPGDGGLAGAGGRGLAGYLVFGVVVGILIAGLARRRGG